MAAEVAVGLLLYSGDGFLRALTLILATLTGALALGLWSAPSPGIGEPVESIRKRWLLALLSFTGGAVTAAGWSVLGGLSSRALTRGLGLALLAAFPLYAVGSLLGTMASVRADRGVRGPGAAASAGASLGAVLTGVLLVRTVAPMTMYVFGVVALSAGALLHGRVLDRVVRETLDGTAVGDEDGGVEEEAPRATEWEIPE